MLTVKAQFINACSDELAVYLLERRPKHLVVLTTCAQQNYMCKTTVQTRRAEQRKPTQSKCEMTQGRQRSLQYYRCQGYGHRQSECATKVSPGKDQKGSTTVSQSSQKK